MSNFALRPAEVRRPLKARLTIEKNLPSELAHGICSRYGSHDVIVRIASSPAHGMTIRLIKAATGSPSRADRNEKLDLYGRNGLHPLDQEYASQLPIRFGPSIAKFALVPSSAGLLALKKHPFSTETPAALREAILAFFEYNPAEFELRIQLYSSGESGGTAAWLQDEPAFRTVGRLIIPAQMALDMMTPAIAAATAA